MSDLYKRIERLCECHDISITTMCRESGASRASLSDLKVGRIQKLSASTLDKIADYFETTVDYLLGRTDDPENSDRFGLDIEFDISQDHTLMNKKAPTESSERYNGDMTHNIIRIAGRDGSYQEKILSDGDLAALKVLLDRLPDARNDL